MKTKFLTPIKLIIIILLANYFVRPILSILLYINKKDVLALLNNPAFLKTIRNSVLLSTIATIISLSLGLLLSLCIIRSSIRKKQLFAIFLTVPMLIPSISHGMGLVILLGANGILTNIFNLPGTIYGFKGIIIGSVLYTLPISFLMFSDVLKYEDISVYHAANILGIPRYRQFFSISLPYLKKPIISTAFIVFTMIITDYGVPLMIGGQVKTLAVMMYQEVIGLLNFSKGSIIAVILLLPAILSFVLDTLNKEIGTQNYVSYKYQIKRNKFFNAFSYLMSILCSFLIILPVFAFILLTFVKKYPNDMSLSLVHIQASIELGVIRYLKNSLFISLLTVVFGIFVSYTVAYLTARSKGLLSRILHVLSTTSLAIPGLVLGLSYVLFFVNSSLYGSFAILILVNLIHFFASPYLMAYNSLLKLNHNLEDVGETLGINRLRMVFSVIIPQSWITMLEMSSYLFVNSMITISAVSFLSNTKTKPLSLLIPGFEGQMRLECAAFVSLIILICNVLMKTIVSIYKRKLSK